MHYNAARISFHHLQVYQRGAFVHFIDDFLLLFHLFCKTVYVGFIKNLIMWRGEGKAFGRDGACLIKLLVLIFFIKTVTMMSLMEST